MNTAKVIENGKLTLENLLKKGITQEQIFEYYFGSKIDLSWRYKNPFRIDNTPGCSFYYNNGSLLFYDVREGSVDVVKFIMRMYGDKYYYALKRIERDFNLISHTTPIVNVNQKIPSIEKIEINRKDFTQEELDFWKTSDFIISQTTLEKNNIYSVKNLFVNGELTEFNLNMCFAYKHGIGKYQIYRPTIDKKKKFRQTSNTYVYGWETLDYNCDYVVITKSGKDHFIGKLAGINNIATISEGCLLEQDKMEWLCLNFKHVILLLDSDETGRNKTRKYLSIYPNLKHLFIPIKWGKDLFGLYKIIGMNELLKLKQKYYENFK